MAENAENSIAGYQLLREVGRGGMGTVYAAKHPRLPREDAIKILAPAYSNDPMFRARFERESQLAASLEHSNIVPVYDCGTDDDRLWISMRLVNGPTAATELKAAGKGLSPSRVIAICLPVAHALDFAHSRNLQHRDVKPENILIDMSTGVPHPLLSDFGIARVVGDTTLTSTGMVIGTVEYSAPEHLSGGATDGRADQYSLACTAAYLLTGTKPFTAANPSAVMMRHLHGERPSISALRPGLPSAIDAVFRRALASNPADRYGSCTEFVTALDAALRAETPTTAIPPMAPAPATSPIAGPTYPPTQFAASEHPHTKLAATKLATSSGYPGHSIPPPYPPHQPPGSATPPGGHQRRATALIVAAIAIVAIIVAGAVTYALLGKSEDDPAPVAAGASDTSAQAESSEATASGETASAPPPVQRYNIVDAQRRSVDPCRIPQNLLTAAGLRSELRPLPPDPEIMLCGADFTGHAPDILMGGYVADSPTAQWVINQYNRGTPAFDDLPGWRRYDATDREAPITRCKYGYVSPTNPKYAFEVTVERDSKRDGFDAQARAEACNRLASVARALDPAMPR